MTEMVIKWPNSWLSQVFCASVYRTISPVLSCDLQVLQGNFVIFFQFYYHLLSNTMWATVLSERQFSSLEDWDFCFQSCLIYNFSFQIRQDKMFVPKLTILFLLALPMINASKSNMYTNSFQQFLTNLLYWYNLQPFLDEL